MSRTLRGLHKGTVVRVTHGGRHGRGIIAREPAAEARHVEMFCTFNGGLHTVPVERVHVVQGPRL